MKFDLFVLEYGYEGSYWWFWVYINLWINVVDRDSCV